MPCLSRARSDYNVLQELYSYVVKKYDERNLGGLHINFNYVVADLTDIGNAIKNIEKGRLPYIDLETTIDKTLSGLASAEEFLDYI